MLPHLSPLRRAQLSVLLSGGYAWLSTVAWPALQSRKGWPALAATGALVGLLLGVWRAPVAARLGRALGLGGATLGALGCWAALGDRLHALTGEPARSLLGAAAWGLFALAWGVFPVRARAPEEDPRARLDLGVSAQDPLSPFPGVVTLVVCGFSGVLLWLALRVTDPAVALLSQALAVSCSLGLLSASAPACLAPRPSRSGGVYDALLVAWGLLGGVLL